MSALSDISDVINRLTGGGSGAPEVINFWKDARVAGAAATTPVAGRFSSLWRYDGQPAAGAVPTTVAVPDNTTDGGLKQTDPAGGFQKWLLGMLAGANVQGMLVLYDRLLHIGGLSGTVTTAQTVAGALTRYTNGKGNEIWVEIYTALGATATTISASYTDQGGTAAQTTPATAIGGTGLNEAQRIIKLPLATGDSGVQAVASVTVLASTLTAGNFGVTIAHPLAAVIVADTGIGDVQNLLRGIPTIQEILTDACLALAWLPFNTTIPYIHHGMISMIEK